MNLFRRILAACLAAVLLLGTASAADPRRGPCFYGNAHYHLKGVSAEMDAGKGFARAAGILRGDSSGEMNWMDELTRATAAVEDNAELYQYFPAYPYAVAGAYIQKYIEQEKSPFTREVAAEALYLMLSIDAGEGQESLADILVEEYGLSDLLCYEYGVRRGAGDLLEQLEGDPARILPGDCALHCAIRDPAFYERIREQGSTDAGDVAPEVAALARSLTQGLASDYDKAEAVSEWICTHIFCDDDAYYGRKATPSQKPADVLESRMAVCEGYAQLTCDMLASVGVACCYQSSDISNHAWNMVYADGAWIAVDNTGGAGRLHVIDGAYTHRAPGEQAAPVGNCLEPGVAWGELEKAQYFDAPLDDFFSCDLHTPDPDPRVFEAYLAPDRFWDPTWTGD